VSAGGVRPGGGVMGGGALRVMRGVRPPHVRDRADPAALTGLLTFRIGYADPDRLSPRG